MSLFFFATWMIHTLTDRDIENIAIKIVLLCAILLLFEWLAIGYNTTRARSFFGIPMQRLIGIGGDPNFTALILSGCSLILIYHRRYLYVAIALIGIFLTASRSAFLPLLYYGLIFIIGKRLRYLSFKIYDIGLVIFLMTPLIILINHWLFATTVYENGYLR